MYDIPLVSMSPTYDIRLPKIVSVTICHRCWVFSLNIVDLLPRCESNLFNFLDFLCFLVVCGTIGSVGQFSITMADRKLSSSISGRNFCSEIFSRGREYGR